MNWIGLLQIVGYLLIGSFVGAVVYTVSNIMGWEDDLDRKIAAMFAGGLWPMTLLIGGMALMVFLAVLLGNLIANGLYWVYREITEPKENV